MALGKGGQSGNQSGTQNSAYSGTGTSTGTSSSATDVTGAGDYRTAWQNLLGGGGNTAGQSTASDFFSKLLGSSTVNPMAQYGAYATEDPYTLAGLESKWGDIYKKPGDISATPVSAGTVTAGTGAAAASPYITGYQTQVTDATLNQLLGQRSKDRNAAAMRSTIDGGAALNSRAGLAQAEIDNQFNRDYASTLAGLNKDAYQFGIGQGQTDASRAAAVNAGNADRGLSADTFSAGQNLAAQQYNNATANQREQFDVNAAYQGNANRNAALDKILGIQTGAANSLAGLGQNTFAQFLAALQSGVPLFGSSTTGSQSGTTSGSGTSSGTSTGNSSSKGGGLSIG